MAVYRLWVPVLMVWVMCVGMGIGVVIFQKMLIEKWAVLS